VHALPAPTSQGDLRKTPLVHLLVYALDHRLGGTLLLGDPEPERTGIHFEDGVPCHLQTPADVAPLEDMLHEMGVRIDDRLSVRLQHAHGPDAPPVSALVIDGLLSEAILREALERQRARRLGYLLTLEPSTGYAYYEGAELLDASVRAEGSRCEPLELIMRGARIRAGDPEVAELLRQLGARPLPLHPDAEPARLGLDAEELAVVSELRARPRSFGQLLVRDVAPPQVARATVYALLITRFIDLSGGTRAPVGVRSP
jgi:hypothetical protein